MELSSSLNVIDGVTYRDEADEQTGHREKVVIETKDKTKIPTIVVEGGKETKHYNLPVGSHIGVEEGDDVKAGQVLVKIPRVLGKLKRYHWRSSSCNRII
jgi:DNA-directed RNA polymerase subunit beta'